MSRTVARIDSNQPALVAYLRGVGASVLHLHTLGRGVPDLLVCHRDTLYLVEVKDGAKPPSKRKLTPDEQRWHAEWNGPVYVIESVDDVVKLLEEGLTAPSPAPPAQPETSAPAASD